MIELNNETRLILGRPNFACIGIAARLRELGHQIENKAEDEQAVTIHWMLTMYEQHGDNWKNEAEAFLKRTPNVVRVERHPRQTACAYGRRAAKLTTE